MMNYSMILNIVCMRRVINLLKLYKKILIKMKNMVNLMKNMKNMLILI